MLTSCHNALASFRVVLPKWTLKVSFSILTFLQAEIFPMRVRAKAISLSTATNWYFVRAYLFVSTVHTYHHITCCSISPLPGPFLQVSLRLLTRLISSSALSTSQRVSTSFFTSPKRRKDSGGSWGYFRSRTYLHCLENRQGGWENKLEDLGTDGKGNHTVSFRIHLTDFGCEIWQFVLTDRTSRKLWGKGTGLTCFYHPELNYMACTPRAILFLVFCLLCCMIFCAESCSSLILTWPFAHNVSCFSVACSKAWGSRGMEAETWWVQ